MAYQIPDDEPAEIRAGDTISWRKSLADYLADDWVLHYRLINATAKYDIDATADGSNHLVEVAAATSAAYTAGDYTWTSWVTSGSDRHTVAQGKITILPDLAAVSAAGYDTRSTAKKTLAVLDAAMIAHGTNNAWTKEYEINGRRMSFKSVSEFLAFRSKVQQEVQNEENVERMKQGLKPKNKILTRFK